ncbi:Uncharacterised protein [Zhongshania aliphaticivorans]|uniref:START domain-containing protein n=1 Tax=Zhongshania aliphaticivorans TaxID=1470434 RepID=A0A5S9NCC6_9GAMM|nr:START domain-containing protein [Zhongshania aliphaticivorans]CAA0087292.1 Uncharacterised protein [Zhongshania aliphaticivorans]CAA0114485.1 Uncharacterised protein [Zhongshania aliphaticivorans]
MKKFQAQFFCLVLAIFSSFSVAATEWKLEKNKSGIKVFTSEVAGSNYKAFRGETVINAELNQLMAVLDDTAGFVNWMFNCKNPQLLYKHNLLDRYQYMINDFPWPATDRELILRNEISQDPETRVTTITLTGVQEDMLPAEAKAIIPKKSDAVRVTEVAGFFELTPLDAGHTKVIFQLHLEPVGKLPSSLVNAMIVDNPFETLKAMSQVVSQPQYENFNPF